MEPCSYHFIMATNLISTLAFNVVFWLEVWSYLSTSFTDPGTPESQEWKAWAERQEGLLEEENSSKICLERPWTDSLEGREDSKETFIQEDTGRFSRRKLVRPGQKTFCNKCHRLRPERAHHCKFKGTCVLRMDHFCWLTGNCVGWRNNKQFILTLFYGVMTCFVFIATAKLPPPHLGRPTLQP